MKSWLLIDSNFLCYRAFHAFGELSHDGVSTAVVYGFLKQLETLQSRFETHQLAFCFDLGIPKRRELFPDYKSSRRRRVDSSPEEKELKRKLEAQIAELREDILPALGYQNVFSASGFEADDLIASLVDGRTLDDEEAIIVSADQDLLQLLRRRVLFFNPGQERIVSRKSFMRERGIKPSDWPWIKAMAGCSTDDVPGVPSVGEKTAIKFLLGQLKPSSKAFQLLRLRKSRQMILRNHSLVRLPLLGTPTFVLRDDDLDPRKWKSVLSRLGIASLRFPT